jgi:hypothetical protein
MDISKAIREGRAVILDPKVSQMLINAEQR